MAGGHLAMSNDFMTEYYLWQNRFINAYNDAKTEPGFLKEIASNHPATYNTQIDDKKLSFVTNRMKNYSRINHSEDGASVYERTPYIDDIFAFCKAKGITPDEIFLNTLRDTVEHFRKFNSIFDLIDKTEIGNYFFETFSIEKKDFDLQTFLPENLIFRVMFKRALIDNFERFFIWDKGRGVKYPLEYLGASKSDCNESKELFVEIVYYIKKSTNNSLINFIFEHDDFKSYWIYGSDWCFSKEFGFDINIETKYEKWSFKRHAMASLHYYILWCAVEAMQEMYKVEDNKCQIFDEKKCCLDYLDKNKDMFHFIEKLFLGTFVIINQSTIIDISGTLYEELELTKEDDEQDEFDRRDNLPKSKDKIIEKKSNSISYEL